MQAAWDLFIDSGKLAPDLDPMIAASWRRCAARLQPQDTPQWAYAAGPLALASTQQNLVRQVARPIMEDVCQYMQGSGALLILTDGSGRLSDLFGDGDLENEARALGFRTDAYLDEGRIGTNAFTLALLEAVPVQIVGAEHFLRCFHGLFTAGAPIFHPVGNPIGILGLLCRLEQHGTQSLGLVFAAAKAVENQLLAEQVIREANVQGSEFLATLDGVADGILAWTPQGIVTHLNVQGGRLLGVRPSLLVGRPLTDHIGLPDLLARSVEQGVELDDLAGVILVDNAPLNCSTSLRVVRQRGGEPAEFILTLRPVIQPHLSAPQAGSARVGHSRLAPPVAVQTFRELEREAIINALRVAGGNHSKAAESLSISRTTLYRKLREMDITTP